MTSKILRSNWIHKILFKNNGQLTVCNNHCYSTSVNVMKKEESKTGTTIDQENLSKFTALSKEWWDPLGPMKPLHSMNLIRVPFVRDGLVQCDPNERNPVPLKNKKILDVGCGGGILSEALAKIGAEVIGIDANSKLIEIAENHSESNIKLTNKPTYMCTTIEVTTVSTRNNMLTLGNGESFVGDLASKCSSENRPGLDRNCPGNEATSAVSNETLGLRFTQNKCVNLLNTDYKKSDLTCRISSTSIFKLTGRKNRDSFTNILLKIQSDLCTLSNKLSNLENRIPM